MDPLRIKLYILLKSPVSALDVSLVYGVYLWPYKVFYYNTNLFYKKKGVRGIVLGHISRLFHMSSYKLR